MSATAGREAVREFGRESRRESGLVWSTSRALIPLRRSAPIVLVTVALVATEYWATRRLIAALMLASFVALFVFLVPTTWRWFQRGPGALRGFVYAVLSAMLVALVTFAAPLAFGYDSYVAHPPATVAIFALVLIAGWVLGRDIELSDDLQRVEALSDALAREAEDARLLAIRQHLDPHFLFNTLGAIAEWCREDPEVAERALLELSAMLRTLFEGIREPLWPLEREIEVLQALHRLHALRDDERYRLESEIDLPEGALVPPLLLLPLFENALTHGGDEAPMQLHVGPDVEISIWNPGAFAGRRAGGTGIETAERRLSLAFGSDATLEIASEERDGIAGTRTRVLYPRAG